MEAAENGFSDEVSANLPLVPTERCLDHNDKLVDMYCADHDAVECYVCLDKYHKNCSSKFYIPEYIESAKQTMGGNKHGIEQAVDKVNEPLRKTTLGGSKQRMEQAVIELSDLLNQYTTSQISLEKGKEKNLEEIQDFQQSLNARLQLLQESSVKAVERECERQNSELAETIKNIQTLKKELESRLTKSSTLEENTLQAFVNAKKADKLIKESKKIQRPVVPALYFSRNTNINKLMNSAPSLGESGQTVGNSHEYNVRVPDDLENSNIWSLYMLDSGDLLMADYSNRKLKILNESTYEIKDSLTLKSEPMFVSRVNASEAVVSLANESILFVKTKDKLKIENTKKMESACAGIAVTKNKMFVADWEKAVNVYSRDGSFHKSLSMDKMNRPLFEKTRDLCISNDGKAVHVTDAVLGLITLDLEGKLIWKYSGDHLQEAWGVCTDGDGNIFVSGWKSNNVVKISKSGKYLEEVVPSSWGLFGPQGLCYDKKSNRLFVARAPKSRLYCFPIKKVETVNLYTRVGRETKK